MMNTARSVGAVLAGLALLLTAPVPASAADPPGFETYVVRRGDTLSGIAGRVLGDGGRWREILKANPQVTNANRIYPGDSLLVPVPVAAAAAAEAGGLAARAGAAAGSVAAAPLPASAAAAGDGSTLAAPATPVAPVAGAAPGEQPATAEMGATASAASRSVAVVNPVLYRSAGSIADRLPSLAIIAADEERELFGPGDAAIVNAALLPGARFTVVRADRRIFHPQTGAAVGWLVHVLGTAEVTCRGERTSTVVMLQMRDAAGIGDYLLPVDPEDILKADTLAGRMTPECVRPGGCSGVVLAFDEDRLQGVEQDLAYIDQGTASGVAPGQRFLIYREIGGEARVSVGELQVLRAAERTATALITTSIQEVQVGDLLRAR